MDHDTMFAYFESHFGYTAEETTALMGAHTQGQNHITDSGYDGSFVEGGFVKFNNQYFIGMFTFSS